MQYPEEFKQKVLSVYSDSEEIRNMLDSGNVFLGRYLDEARQGGLSPKEVVDAYESMNLLAIYQKAKRKLALQELYSEWGEIYISQNSHKMHR